MVIRDKKNFMLAAWCLVTNYRELTMNFTMNYSFHHEFH